MEQRIVKKIMDECEALFDTIPNEQFTTWNFLVNVNRVVSEHEGIDCLMNVTFDNGGVGKALCVITDWNPGALAFQSDDGELPKMRVVFPEEYAAFMEEVEPIFEAQYPAFPKDQE